jgi:hypothetical protein
VTTTGLDRFHPSDVTVTTDDVVCFVAGATHYVLQAANSDSCTRSISPVLADVAPGQVVRHRFLNSGVFFIMGDSDRCNQGMRGVVRVMTPSEVEPTTAPSAAPTSVPDSGPDSDSSEGSNGNSGGWTNASSFAGADAGAGVGG